MLPYAAFLLQVWNLAFYTPAQISWGRYTGFTLSVYPSDDRIVSALYLLQYSPDPLHIYTSYQATSCVWHVKFVFLIQIIWICNFDFVKFWREIQYELVNSMGKHGAVGRTQVVQLFYL